MSVSAIVIYTYLASIVVTMPFSFIHEYKVRPHFESYDNFNKIGSSITIAIFPLVNLVSLFFVFIPDIMASLRNRRIERNKIKVVYSFEEIKDLILPKNSIDEFDGLIVTARLLDIKTKIEYAIDYKKSNNKQRETFIRCWFDVPYGLHLKFYFNSSMKLDRMKLHNTGNGFLLESRKIEDIILLLKNKLSEEK